jgi:hypothetical protein
MSADTLAVVVVVGAAVAFLARRALGSLRRRKDACGGCGCGGQRTQGQRT